MLAGTEGALLSEHLTYRVNQKSDEILAGTLLSEHLTPEEFSCLSYEDRALVRAVKILIPSTSSSERSEHQAQDEAYRNPVATETIYSGLVGFQCVYCASSPVMMPQKSSAVFHRVFPGSVQSMEASLHLLRDRHYSFEAAQFQQRCIFLPTSEKRIFYQKNQQDIKQETELDLQTCCERVASRLGFEDKKPGEKAGIIISTGQKEAVLPPSPSIDRKRSRVEFDLRQESGASARAETRERYTRSVMNFPASSRGQSDIGVTPSHPKISQASLSPPRSKSGAELTGWLPEMGQTSLSPRHSRYGMDHAAWLHSLQGNTSARQVHTSTQIAPPPVSPYVAPSYLGFSGSYCQAEEGRFTNLHPGTSGMTSNTPNRFFGFGSVGVSHERNPITPIINVTPGSTRTSPLSFIHNGLGWNCPHCLHIPFNLRATGSFQQEMPSPERAYTHFRQCIGLRQLSESLQRRVGSDV